MTSDKGTGDSQHHISAYRLILSFLILAAVIGAVCVLMHPAANVSDRDKLIPKLPDAPIYEALKEGEPYICTYTPDRDLDIDGLSVLMVHTDGTDIASGYRPYVRADIMSGTLSLAEYDIYMDETATGEWNTLPVSVQAAAGSTLTLSFTAFYCEPYFMKVADYEPGISVGFDVKNERTVTYGDIFYYSVPLIILMGTVAIFITLFGVKRMKSACVRLKQALPGYKYATPIFLILFLAAFAINIINVAYREGVYITSDSDGYLREAVNLAVGNGFSYDGIAGYRSHFANWPILYPAFIAVVMLSTGNNAYLASKIAAIIVTGLILLLIYTEFGKDAFLPALALVNTGYMGLVYNTWSEPLFIFFMMLFVMSLGRIAGRAAASRTSYICLGISALGAFLTRYFGLFLWCVGGVYILIFIIRAYKGDTGYKGKAVCSVISLSSSAVVSFAYLIMNKRLNGNPTGVSRGTWWDDYITLTDDLVHSLITEVFNIFRTDVPTLISRLKAPHQLICVFMIMLAVVLLVSVCLRRIYTDTGISDADTDKDVCIYDVLCDRHMIYILTSAVYYVMFIVIRYRSSMDTFYFRFFAPATVLFMIGLSGLLLRSGVLTRGVKNMLMLIACVTVLTVLSDEAGRYADTVNDRTYYEMLTNGWDAAYAEIPAGSVIIWNPMDYRSTWYRPDVYSGQLYQDDTWDDIIKRYYGSGYICMLKSDAKIVVSDGGYDESVVSVLYDAISRSDKDDIYVVLER